MPLDAIQTDDGSIERKRGLQTERWYGRVVPFGERDRPLHTSHFATCPNAKKHRRPR